MESIRLTQYSHGAGCGCKISPALLTQMLKTNQHASSFPNLLVGNDTRDDAAVYELENEECIISTTDFFMPIVDDAFDFGRIASANAISDVYAMGGKPLMAIAILGWPIDKLAPEVAQQVLEGSRSICAEAGIPLAGGHSIDCPEPIFGLAVTGRVNKKNLKQNSKAKQGASLYISKPIGVGILTTAQKKGLLLPEHAAIATQNMVKLNSLGCTIAVLPEVEAITDITGFGLFGHLLEVCQGSGLSATIEFDRVPLLPQVKHYLDLGCIPGGTHRNWKSYGEYVKVDHEAQQFILSDPQTSGGLLIAVQEGSEEFFEEYVQRESKDSIWRIGKLHASSSNPEITVK